MKRTFIGAILISASYSCLANGPGSVSPAPAGYYLLLGKINNGWKVDSIGLTPPNVTDPRTQEIIYADNWYGEFQPYFADYVQWYQRNYPKGSAGYMHSMKWYSYNCYSGQKNERPAYNPCDSNLTTQTNKSISVASNVLIGVLSLGTSLRNGVETVVSVDKEKLSQALVSSDAVSMLKAYQQKAIEQSDFDHATSSLALRNFIAKYQNNDPDRLVAQAEKQLPDVEAKETEEAHAQYQQAFESASSESDLESFIGKYHGDDPDNLVPKAQLKLNSVIAKKDAEERQAREELAKWQNSLQVGDETNCGEVLELRRGLVKVNFPVENYGNEHWIKKNLILKPDAGCQFVNGNYIPPFPR